MSTFLSGFEGLWRRPARDYQTAVKEYLIVVDTNVLLELYRFTPKAREELFNVLGKLGNRLWVPHQVVKEYYTQRVSAVKEHLDLYSSIPNALEDYQRKSLQELSAFAKRCSMSASDKRLLVAPIEQAFRKVIAEIVRHGESFDLSLEKVVNEDPVLETLARILDGKTGRPFDEEEVESMLLEFGRRAEDKVPPGYRDAHKTENPHGDYFVWEQLLREACLRESPVLFVTNDAKDDWVRREAGFILGARPELIVEFKSRCGKDFIMTQLGRFLGIAKEELGASVSPSTVAQAENLRSAAFDSSVAMDLPHSILSRLLGLIDSDLRSEFAAREASGDGSVTDEMRQLADLRTTIKRSAAALGNGDVRIAVSSKEYPRFQALLRKANGQLQESIDNSSQGSIVAQKWNEVSQIEQRLDLSRKAYRAASEKFLIADRDIGVLGEEEVESRRKLIDDAKKARVDRRRYRREIAALEKELGELLLRIQSRDEGS